MVKFFTTMGAGVDRGAAERADARDGVEAMRATVEIFGGDGAGGKGEGVTTGFVGDSESDTCGAPFAAMTGDAFSGVGGMCEEVGEFMFQNAIQLISRKLQQEWIEFNSVELMKGASGSGSQAWVPDDAEFACEFDEPEVTRERDCGGSQGKQECLRIMRKRNGMGLLGLGDSSLGRMGRMDRMRRVGW